MAFFAVSNRQSSQMALTIAANRGHRKQNSFYRTSKISGFSVVRAASSNIISPSSLQAREFANIAHPKPFSRFSFDAGVIDLLDLNPGEIEPMTVSVSPESLERAAWFSSVSSDDEEEENCREDGEELLMPVEDSPSSVDALDESSFSEKITVSNLMARINSKDNIRTISSARQEEQTSASTSTSSSVAEFGGPLQIEERTQDDSEREMDDSLLELNCPNKLERFIQSDGLERKPIVVEPSAIEKRLPRVGEKEWTDVDETSDNECDGEEKGGVGIVQSATFANVPQVLEQEGTGWGEEWSPQNQDYQQGSRIWSSLSAEIVDMVQWVDAQHENSAFVRHENSRLLKECIKAALGEGVNVVEYGSSAVGLALPDSDLDFVVVLEKRSNAFTLSRASQIDCLSKVVTALSSETWVQKLTFVDTAGIPVVKFLGIGGRSIDLSCLGQHHHGLRTQLMVQDHLASQPHLRALVLVLKQLVKDRGVGDKASGGVSSYALFIVVACFLSWHDEMMIQSTDISVGWMLLAFLEQHSVMLDYPSLVFTVKGYSPRSIEWAHFAADLMAVADPFDPDRNVTRGLYRLSQFSGVLRGVWASLGQGQPLASVLNTHPPPVIAPTHTSWSKRPTAYS